MRASFLQGYEKTSFDDPILVYIGLLVIFSKIIWLQNWSKTDHFMRTISFLDAEVMICLHTSSD